MTCCGMEDVIMEDLSQPESQRNRRQSLGSSENVKTEKFTETFNTAVFAWGSTVDGELGLGGLEEDHIAEPTRLDIPAGRVKSSRNTSIFCLIKFRKVKLQSLQYCIISIRSILWRVSHYFPARRWVCMVLWK